MLVEKVLDLESRELGSRSASIKCEAPYLAPLD